MKAILIYSAHSSEKFEYVCKFFFREQLGLTYAITNNLDHFISIDNQIRVAYSDSEVNADLIIHNSNYFQNFSIEYVPEFSKELSFIKGKTSFDFIAATFYLLARVEEYVEGNRDAHGRYSSHQSILSQKKLLAHPVVDYWIETLLDQLGEIGSESLKLQSSYRFNSTIDVDHIYAFRHKPIHVKVGSAIKALLTLKLNKFLDRFKATDPFDRFEDIISWHVESKIAPTFFILCASKSQFDRSLSPSNKAFINKIKFLARSSKIGIHPSYLSNTDFQKLKEEKIDLESIISKAVFSSRQHYLKVSFPRTYHNLLSIGITEDHSMGYHDAIGFRAGTSKRYKWYDLEKDEETDLTLVPFQVMDVTLKKYLNLPPSLALSEVINLVDRVKMVQGEFSLIFHNSSFYPREGWTGWEELYREVISYAKA